MDPNYLKFPGHNNSYPWQNYASMIVMWSFFCIGQPHLFTKFFTMKNYGTMFKAVLLGTLGMWFSASFIEWCGVTGAASFAKAYLRPFAPVRICMDASAVFHAPPSST